MANGTTTYSMRDTVGAIVSPLAGPFTVAGARLGVGQIVFSMLTARSEMDTSADGAVMVSAIPGNAANADIEIQQTSALHKYLLLANNLHQTAVENGDVSNWAGITMQLRNILDGSQHMATGVSIVKTPDKTYASRGGMVRWQLAVANLTNL